MKATYFKHTLEFLKPSRTSRGVLTRHTAYILVLQEAGKTGFGEASPLPGLSIDDRDDFENVLQQCCALINNGTPVMDAVTPEFPALVFGFETALLSLKGNHPFALYQNAFMQHKGIEINGLVWMSRKDEMLKEAMEKAEQGFSCLKFKIGALDFDEECRMLEAVRKQYSAFRLDIRLDANGAFDPEEALEKLNELSRFDIHSIEQPIKPGQTEQMESLCRQSKIGIALDEELIGVAVKESGESLLRNINPAYLILKPTLIGGFSAADDWIRLCKKNGTAWWATSALESNIGLNAIAQWCMEHNPSIPQGLGTGGLYTNNIPSPLTIQHGSLFYNSGGHWTLPDLSDQ